MEMEPIIEPLELMGEKLLPEALIGYWEKAKQNNITIREIRRSNDGGWRPESAQPGISHLAVTIPSGKIIEVIIYGRGKPLLLIAGLGATAPIWFEQIARLASKYQVIIIHKPGHGLSETTDDLSYKGISNVIYEVLDVLRIQQPVNIIGACIGGLIALNFAAFHPERTAALILAGTIYKWDTDAFDDGPMDRLKAKKISVFLNSFDASLTRDFEYIMSRIYGPDCDLPEYRRKFEMQIKSKVIDPFAYVKYVLDITKGEKIFDLIPKVQCPSLLVAGGRDSVISPENSKILQRLIMGSEYFELSAAGHFPYITHEHEFNDKIIRFLANISS
jgi:pimeloyl-ACP methyl ester carboxylesterase